MRTPTSKAIRLVQGVLGGMVIRVDKLECDTDGAVRASLFDSADAVSESCDGSGEAD